MPDLRENVITVLQSIASKDQQYDWYRATGGDGNLARDLWTCWIRDAYVPHDPRFALAFTAFELDQLERFTQFFEARLADFPPRFEKLMVDMYWSSVLDYAAGLLEDLARHDEGDASS